MLIGAILPAAAQCPQAGTSTAVWGAAPDAAQLRQAAEEGIEWVEVALNQCCRNVPSDDQLPRMQSLKASIDSAGVAVWSVHLPFSRTLDISVTDDSLRAANVHYLAQMIRLSGRLYAPKRIVLHPSSEPITDQERTARIENAIASIRTLKSIADEADAELCIENLPRTCLGNTPEELLRIVDSVPGTGICFDTNHYTRGTVAHFINVTADRIRTVHISDYDFVYERHWLPYEGSIDWGVFVRDLRRKARYDGVMMFEVKHRRRNGDVTTPRDITESIGRMYDDYERIN